ncbi:MAG: DSD1 family PLP-dependent enzyme, partial [Alphaproteobacteria bacterium]|nr:DSD1 family PLP-dependent enzyme [Alphaproteobacteria bacterium]
VRRVERPRRGLHVVSAVGQDVASLDTPALLVDLDALDRNIAALAAHMREAGVAWRPHVKGIKVPAIAHRLIGAGAHGITCAKLSEAEVMAASGLGNILIANQVVGDAKLRRLACLRRTTDVMVAVDSAENVRAIGAAATATGVTLGVLVEVNIGLNRCGVEPGEATVSLARLAHATPGIAFRGVMGWEGHTLTIARPDEKEAAVAAAVGALTRSAAACRAAGLPAEIVSCGGSGSYRHSARQPGVTEIEAGGAVFGDCFYRLTGAQTECALTVLTTVTSRPAPDRVVADAGKKTMSGETALPEPIGIGGVTRLRLAAEHATLDLAAPVDWPRVGDKLSFTVGYGDTTVCLHDFLYGVRGGRVESVWPVLGRGKVQ